MAEFLALRCSLWKIWLILSYTNEMNMCARSVSHTRTRAHEKYSSFATCFSAHTHTHAHIPLTDEMRLLQDN